MAPKDTEYADASRSEQLYRDLWDAARKSKREELERLWNVLRDIRRSGLDDYTLAKVGARLELVGGLRTQSLRNLGGKDYRSLITAFADDVGGRSTNSKPHRPNVSGDWIEQISDVQLRAWARQMVAENKLLQRQVNELKSAFKALRVYDPTKRVKAPPPMTDVKQPADARAQGLSVSELQMLKKSLASCRMAENGWTLSPDGSVKDDLGIAIFPPGFAGIIDKLAAL